MNYIELCERTRMECGVSGSDNSVNGAVGEWFRIITWVNQAWLYVQNEFISNDILRRAFLFPTVPMKQSYTPDEIGLSNFQRWSNASFRLMQNSVGDERILDQIPFDTFRDTWLLASNKVSFQVPTVIAVGPDQSLWLALPPNDEYQINGEYYCVPHEMKADHDEPENFPAHYHMMIVYKAMQHFAMYENASEVLQRGANEYQKLKERYTYDYTQPVVIDRSQYFNY